MKILVFTGNVNENHPKVLLFSWAGKTSSHSLCQCGSVAVVMIKNCQCFPDIPLQWLPLYNSSWLPIYKHSFISCQFSSSCLAVFSWMYLKKTFLDSKAPFQCFQIWLINAWQVIMHPCMTRSHRIVLLINKYLYWQKESTAIPEGRMVPTPQLCPYFNWSFAKVILILPDFWLISKEDNNGEMSPLQNILEKWC